MSLENRATDDRVSGPVWASLPMDTDGAMTCLDVYTGSRAETTAMLDGDRWPGARLAAPAVLKTGSGAGRVQLAQAGGATMDGFGGFELPSIGRALGAVTRLEAGALLIGGEIVTAAILLQEVAGAERAQVEEAFAKFGLDRTQATDVLAARAYVWGHNWAPRAFWSVPFSGDANETVARALMRNEQANPTMLGLAANGDAQAQKGIKEVVEEAMAGVTPELTEPLERRSNVAPALSTSSVRARSLLNISTQSWQAHHLIPFAVVATLPPAVQLAMAKAGWVMDSFENLIALPANFPTYVGPLNQTANPIHNTSHPIYSAYARTSLNHIVAVGTSIEPTVMRTELAGIERLMRDYLLKKLPLIHPILR